MFVARRTMVATILLFAATALLTTAHSAYKGHADDSDINAVLTAYPELKGTAADSCAICHKSGRVKEGTASRHESHCGYCHAVHVRGGQVASETLNSFGVDYLATGRGITAVQSIAKRDSDRDGFSNEAELLKGTDPGDATSTPSTPIATNRTFTAAELKALSPVVRKAVFLNTSRNKQGDFYNEYRGNAVYELLQAMGISENAESVDFISMDGFEGSFILGEPKSEWPQAAPVMKLGKDTAGPCGWVNYNVAGLDEKKPLPAMNIMLAFEENGKKIDAGKLDPGTGRIHGTGPLRLVVPQFKSSPPDLPEFVEKSCREKFAKEYQFSENYDHNGGRSSFSIIAIRVNPLPKGTRDYDWGKVRNELATGEKLVVFGALTRRAK